MPPTPDLQWHCPLLGWHQGPAAPARGGKDPCGSHQQPEKQRGETLDFLLFYCQIMTSQTYSSRWSYKTLWLCYIFPNFELFWSPFILLFWPIENTLADPGLPPVQCLTCAGVGGVEGQWWMAVVAVATALAPAPDSVVPAVIANAPTGATGGEPCPLREVTAFCVTVALAPWSHRGVTLEQSERGERDQVRAAGWGGAQVSTDSLTLTWVGLPAAAVGGPPGTITVEWGTLLAVLPGCVVSTQTPAKHLEDTSGAAQLLHTCCLDL